jgi:rubredoxin
MMKKWRCNVCGYMYDPKQGDRENGIMPGWPFEKLPDHWGCPECGASPDMFERLDDEGYYISH